MEVADINNYFGDMDLFLMDLILKGRVSVDARILDVGCGEGRNGIFFIRNGYGYQGWDSDASKLKLLEYLVHTLDHHKSSFYQVDLLAANTAEKFDLIICSRVLHFSDSIDDFHKKWQKLASLLNNGGIIYLSMDSAIDNTLASPIGGGKFEFPDTKIRVALTNDLYREMKKGFEEIEPLRTLAHHNERAQSFVVLRKV
ncbi:class I SAM-dependent methyltransferase [Ekhidna sp. MALMAid0563]|uniref:class I SAM-dependent methyltransferase n=1 Tax=Ekhidna sp. MALMAid0563 TaxID=3143937 RepID=UPI0032DF1450